jgi:hypothetical protein
MRLLTQAVAWLACSLCWADESADDGAVAAQGKRCNFFVDAAAATAGASAKVSASELREAEVACIAQLSAGAGQRDPSGSSADSIYTALLYVCNRGPAATEEHVAALAGPLLCGHDDSATVPFYQGLARRRGAGAVAEVGWRQGLAIAHSEVLDTRTPGAVVFTLNAAKLAWNWTPRPVPKQPPRSRAVPTAPSVDRATTAARSSRWRRSWRCWR